MIESLSDFVSLCETFFNFLFEVNWVKTSAQSVSPFVSELGDLPA